MERDGFEPAVPLVQHEPANFCDFAFSAREAEGISEAGGAGEGLAAGRVTSDVCVFPEGAGRYEARYLRSACARSGGGVSLPSLSGPGSRVRLTLRALYLRSITTDTEDSSAKRRTVWSTIMTLP